MGNYFVVFRKISIFASWYSAFCWICGHTLYGCVDWNIDKYKTQPWQLVTPCMGVWIETLNVTNLVRLHTSHPVWVCGLKQRTGESVDSKLQSHPVWVCGLKHCNTIITQEIRKSHPVWVCGLKLYPQWDDEEKSLSHPVWVCGLKLYRLQVNLKSLLSHPVWVCGLKHN